MTSWTHLPEPATTIAHTHADFLALPRIKPLACAWLFPGHDSAALPNLSLVPNHPSRTTNIPAGMSQPDAAKQPSTSLPPNSASTAIARESNSNLQWHQTFPTPVAASKSALVSGQSPPLHSVGGPFRIFPDSPGLALMYSCSSPGCAGRANTAQTILKRTGGVVLAISSHSDGLTLGYFVDEVRTASITHAVECVGRFAHDLKSGEFLKVTVVMNGKYLHIDRFIRLADGYYLHDHVVARPAKSTLDRIGGLIPGLLPEPIQIDSRTTAMLRQIQNFSSPGAVPVRASDSNFARESLGIYEVQLIQSSGGFINNVPQPSPPMSSDVRSPPQHLAQCRRPTVILSELPPNERDELRKRLLAKLNRQDARSPIPPFGVSVVPAGLVGQHINIVDAQECPSELDPSPVTTLASASISTQQLRALHQSRSNASTPGSGRMALSPIQYSPVLESPAAKRGHRHLGDQEKLAHLSHTTRGPPVVDNEEYGNPVPPGSVTRLMHPSESNMLQPSDLYHRRLVTQSRLGNTYPPHVFGTSSVADISERSQYFTQPTPAKVASVGAPHLSFNVSQAILPEGMNSGRQDESSQILQQGQLFNAKTAQQSNGTGQTARSYSMLPMRISSSQHAGFGFNSCRSNPQVPEVNPINANLDMPSDSSLHDGRLLFAESLAQAPELTIEEHNEIETIASPSYKPEIVPTGPYGVTSDRSFAGTSATGNAAIDPRGSSSLLCLQPLRHELDGKYDPIFTQHAELHGPARLGSYPESSPAVNWFGGESGAPTSFRSAGVVDNSGVVTSAELRELLSSLPVPVSQEATILSDAAAMGAPDGLETSEMPVAVALSSPPSGDGGSRAIGAVDSDGFTAPEGREMNLLERRIGGEVAEHAGSATLAQRSSSSGADVSGRKAQTKCFSQKSKGSGIDDAMFDGASSTSRGGGGTTFDCDAENLNEEDDNDDVRDDDGPVDDGNNEGNGNGGEVLGIGALSSSAAGTSSGGTTTTTSGSARGRGRGRGGGRGWLTATPSDIVMRNRISAQKSNEKRRRRILASKNELILLKTVTLPRLKVVELVLRAENERVKQALAEKYGRHVTSLESFY